MDIEREKYLIQQAHTDENAFEELYAYYYPIILNYLVRRTLDVQLSNDLTSITFIKAYRRTTHFNWRGIRFRAWLYRVAHNEMVSHYRKNNRIVSLEKYIASTGIEPSAELDIEDEIIAAEEKLRQHQIFLQVQADIQKLAPKYQEVLHLRYFENLSIRDISEVTGKREGTVKSLLSRGITRLRDIQMINGQKVAMQPKISSRVLLLEE